MRRRRSTTQVLSIQIPMKTDYRMVKKSKDGRGRLMTRGLVKLVSIESVHYSQDQSNEDR